MAVMVRGLSLIHILRPTFGGWSSHSSNDSVGFDKMQQDISGHYFFPREGAYVPVSYTHLLLSPEIFSKLTNAIIQEYSSNIK